MKTIEAIQSRRSVKHFDATHRMTADDANKILSLAMLSPTAFNIQNWRFVVVDDNDLRRKIREASYDQSQVTDTSLFIILCADLKAWEKKPERYWENSPKEVQAFMLPTIDGYYRDNEQVQRDEAMRSCGIAAQTIMLTAKSLGYDSNPMDGFDFEKVAQLICLPDDHIITLFVAIGKATKAAWPRTGQLGVEDVVINNVFKQ
ncbi:MAG: nitroreductase family protein [Robiginitomaculum sp.]|nr:nitroreductase family protein [Robiginitomaculum sp.]